MTTPTRKLSAITQAGRSPIASDLLVGVTAGNADVLLQPIRQLTADITVYAGFFVGTLVGGSSYTTGTYLGVSLTGGAGSGATADFFVAGGAIIAVRITSKGTGYAIGNV